MSKARILAGRVPFMPLLVLALVQVGCAPARHAVRLQTADGQVRVTTPPPRPPLALPKEEVRQTVRALAQQVVPVADPVEFARERFGMPVLEGVYVLNGRTKELRPADKATEASEVPPPELIEQTRTYLNYCAVALRQPGDCFGALRGHRYLDAHGRYMVAMGIAIAGTFEATGESIKDMLSVKEVLGMVVAGVTMYAVLWVLPEPTSKGIAAAMTIVMVGYVGVHTLYTLGNGFVDLIEGSEKAITFEALKEEGDRFARVMGADNARVLVMVATAAVGSGLSQFLKALPTFPGAGPASELAVAEGGVPFGQVGAVEAVTIGKGGLTISLTTGAVLASSLGVNSGGGPRISRIPEKPARNSVKFDPKRAQHVFRDKPGHVNPPTSEGQADYARLFERVASDPANLRMDAVDAGLISQEAANAGVQAFTWSGPSGQIWVTVCDGLIQNAGLNLPGAFR